jgi:hypothetical protein
MYFALNHLGLKRDITRKREKNREKYILKKK